MENKFYKIGEISKLLDLRSSTLRYWETEFHQLRPIKSSGGQRFYTQKHIDLLQNLKQMLYSEKYTIDGVKKQLKNGAAAKKIKENDEISHMDALPQNAISQSDIRRELISILAILK